MFEWQRILVPSEQKPSPTQLTQFELEIGYSLPDEYRRFLLEVNGGRVRIAHEIVIPCCDEQVMVQTIYPFSVDTPFVGVRECRQLQTASRVAGKQVLQIGGDAGTGYYYLLLDGPIAGGVYYAYKDDLELLSPEEWIIAHVGAPEYMMLVAPTFSHFGESIMLGATDISL